MKIGTFTLRKLLLLALVVTAGWQYYQKSTHTSHSVIAAPTNEQQLQPAPYNPTPRFSCDGRQHCSQMTSRAEAVFFINNCPNTKMDGDRDGVPCENDSRF
ncbi:excalibur calcium-binding domain-containing protein [Pontibacterium sp.]|uniref:excalibur calcium-binding domain-containing protein n=1 Tax=Pontibacterium sp. TaxID=2036026 RepID=UPI0035187F65